MVYNIPYYNLLIQSSSIFIIGFIVLYSYTKSIKTAYFIALIKAFIFFIFFNNFFNFSYTFLDDVTYIETSIEYINNGKTFLSLLSQPLDLVFAFGKWHYLYYLYNILSIEIFGAFYSSPVAFSVILTFFSSLVLYRLLLLLNFPMKVSIYISVFFILHWDLIVWSSFFDLKDTFVQFLTISLIYLIIKNDMKIKFINIFLISFLILLMTFLRFYIPYFIVISYVFFLFLRKYIDSKKNKLMYFTIILVGFTILIILINAFFLKEVTLFFNNFTNPIIGSIRYLLTPLPFHMDEGYKFLFFSSILNFLFFPFLIYGIFIFSKSNLLNSYKYFILIYLFIILLFYGSFVELQGPRHKVQIIPFLVIFEFIGFVTFFLKTNFLKAIHEKNNIPN